MIEKLKFDKMVASKKGKGMKKILPISIVAVFSVAPVFADNITAASTCTNGVLGTYTGPANIEANFDPNTINTTWYSNGTQLTGNNIPATCTYDAALTPPTPADRPGYVFNGWRLIIPPFNLTTLDSTIHSTSYEYKAINYGTTSPYNQYTPQTSSGANAAGLNNGEWMATFSYGTIYGRAYCSNIWGDSINQEYYYYYYSNRYQHLIEDGSGDCYWPSGRSNEWRKTDDQVTAGRGDSCFCQVTAFTPQNGTRQTVSTTNWVYWTGAGTSERCASAYQYDPATRNPEAERECNYLSCEAQCAYLCARETMDTTSTDYRNTYLPALYGISQ